MQLLLLTTVDRTIIARAQIIPTTSQNMDIALGGQTDRESEDQ
jgi:hypothetical protein